jgi:hypothetical protein
MNPSASINKPNTTVSSVKSGELPMKFLFWLKIPKYLKYC